MTRSALEVVTLYNLEIWNKGRLDLVPELCADPMIRYDANSVTTVSIEEQIARIRHNFEELRPTFEPVVLAGGDEFVTLVWNVTGRDPDWKWCGIEVFRVVGGKIVEVWNGPYVDGRWVGGGALELGSPGGPRRAVPVNSAAFIDGRARIVVPLDDTAIDIWLGTIFGPPVSGGEEARFAWTGTPDRLDVAFAESGREPVMMADAFAESLEIRWARSGLTNVTISLTGNPAAAERPLTIPRAAAKRLAECTGRLSIGGADTAHVVGASIELHATSGKASGDVTLRMQSGIDPDTLSRVGSLSFSWHSDGAAVCFDMPEAHLSPPESSFADGDETETLYRWTAPDVVATRPRAGSGAKESKGQ